MLRLNHINNPPGLSTDVKFFRPVVNIHKKKIIQQKVLNKVIPIQPLLVGNDQILDLTDPDLSDHIRICVSP